MIRKLDLNSVLKADSTINLISTSLLYLAIGFIIFITFVTQNKKVGFEAEHHGWGSSHSLAIISKANLDNGFVGHTISIKNEQGQLDYYYFDRYPVFFSVFANLLLSFSDDLAAKVYIIRQMMNFVFLANIFISLMLINKLIQDKYLALAVVLVSFSNYFLLYYKDMVYFDPPALFGFIFLLYAIAVYKIDGQKRLLYIAAFLSIALGRGYASYAIMILWVMMECYLIIRSSEWKISELFTRITRHSSVTVLVIAIIWGAILLGYNIHIEAQTIGLPYTKTSIVTSASKRLSLDETFNEQYQDKLRWTKFIPEQFDRIINLAIPQGHRQLGPLKYLILLPMMIFIPIFIKKQEPDQRLIPLLMILSGIAWLFPLRNLTVFHYFTIMYYIGIPLVLYMAIFSTIKFLKQHKYFLLIFCLVLYAASNLLLYQKHSEIAEQVNDYTYDFNRIKQQIVGQHKNIHVQGNLEDLVPGAPFAIGFYLPEHHISPLEMSDYIISKNKDYASNPLTPFNKKIFLFEK
jgi:hypothetical protein